MLNFTGEVGGPEEDRTPDLLIAKVAAVRNINDLRRRSNVENSPKQGGESTNWAQSPKGMIAGSARAASNGHPLTYREI